MQAEAEWCRLTSAPICQGLGKMVPAPCHLIMQYLDLPSRGKVKKGLGHLECVPGSGWGQMSRDFHIDYLQLTEHMRLG